MKKQAVIYYIKYKNIHSKTVRPLNFPWRHLLLLLHFCFCLRSKVCHLNAMASSGGVMDEIIDRRNKAVTFIALSDLLRHQGNKQKAKLIVPDHIRPVTPPPDPTGTTALFCFQHALLPFSAAPDILTKKQTAWRPKAGLELQMWQSDLWDDQSSDFLLRDSDWGANGPVG